MAATEHHTLVDCIPELDPTECPEWIWECSCGEQGHGYRTGVAAEYGATLHQIEATKEARPCTA